MALFDNWKEEDIYKYRDNKANWHGTDNQAYKGVYSINNDNLRALYGIDKSQDVSLGEVDAYIANMEKQKAANNQKNTLLTNLTQKAMNGGTQVQKSADAVRNFKYDPSTDPAYQTYVDMYNRQGQSAAKSTLNNLNSASMGRSSSYSAAATAQVQQAYAQKASEMIPTLAEQAYNKLLQQYNIDKDMSDTQYNRQLTAYQTLADAGTRELTDQQLKLSNEQAEIYNKYYPTLIGNEVESSDMSLQEQKLNLEALPEKIKIELESGRLANELTSLQKEYQTYENRIAAVTAEIQEKYGLKMAEAEYVASQLVGSSRSGSGGSYSSSSSKEMDKRNTDSYISSYLYSDVLNPDGSGTWQGTSSHPQYYAVDKLNNADIVASIVDSLIEAGYTYAQAKDKIEEYKTNVTIETMKIEGKQGWDDEDVVKARKNVLFG